AERRRPAVVRTRMPRACPCDDRSHATTSAGSLCGARNSTFRPTLKSGRGVDPAPQRGRSPPPPARDGGPVTVARSRARDQTPFFEFCHDGVGTDMQDTCGITNPTGVHRHLDDLLFDRRRLAWIVIVQEESTASTAVLAAPVPLFVLPG